MEVLQDVNKLLKFAKANDDVGITVKKIANKLEDFIFVFLTDAAWAVRHDGTSQGGYLIVLTNRKVLNTSRASTSCWIGAAASSLVCLAAVSAVRRKPPPWESTRWSW